MRESLEDERFVDFESAVFDKDSTYEQYKSDICRFLIYCSWKYSPERTAETVKMHEKLVKKAYENQEPVDSIALDIGYGCG